MNSLFVNFTLCGECTGFLSPKVYLLRVNLHKSPFLFFDEILSFLKNDINERASGNDQIS